MKFIKRVKSEVNLKEYFNSKYLNNIRTLVINDDVITILNMIYEIDDTNLDKITLDKFPHDFDNSSITEDTLEDLKIFLSGYDYDYVRFDSENEMHLIDKTIRLTLEGYKCFYLYPFNKTEIYTLLFLKNK